MSAIFGAINLTGNKIDKNVKTVLMDGFNKCVIDSYNEISNDNLYMGCGIQYITKESIYEKLPLENKEIFFDADVVIDNRKQLLQRLEKEDNKEIPDGSILFEYFCKYGEHSLNDLLGAYCFVFYDKKKNEIQIVSDAVGYRYIYYFIEDNVFYYSSLMKPLEKLMKKHKINERWIADYIGQDSLNIFTESEETPVEGLYRIAPAHSIKISMTGVSKYRYWDPTKDIKKIRYKNDGEYRENFINLYRECVTDLLRANGETAIMLSGGYDSTSVACLAAIELQKSGKKLYSYTAVPFEGYKSEFDENSIVDETELVNKTQEYYPNIVCDFMHMPEMNGWFDRKFYINIAEMPYKSPQNMLWMYESMRRAYKKNARIMLSGAFGNGTVSFDNKEVYLVWLFEHFKWIKLYKEITSINKKHSYTRKSLFNTTVKNALRLNYYMPSKEEICGNSYAKMEFLNKYGTLDRLEELYKRLAKADSNHKIYHDSFIPLDTFRHYGEFSQKNSLYTGVILRDPTRDKRMIEFTYGIPYNQFTNDGVFRRLITEYMDDIVPKHVINEKRTGRQSADLKARICRNKEKIKYEMIRCFECNIDSEIIDCKKALQHINNKDLESMEDFEIVRLIFTASLLEYMESFNKK